ncbi:MAG: WD40 repeat domain-containing protein, partial [Candidatus Babeliales bacterium]
MKNLVKVYAAIFFLFVPIYMAGKPSQKAQPSKPKATNSTKVTRVVTADTISPSTGKTLTTFTQSVKTNKDLTVTGNETCSGTLTAAKATTLKSTLGVTGDLKVNTTKFTVAATTGNTSVAGTLGVKGNLTVNTNKFTANATTGNTTIAGTLGVAGTSNLGVLNTSGAATLNSLGVTNNATVGGTLDVTGDTTLGILNTSNTSIDGALEVAEAAKLSETLDVGEKDINLVLESTKTIYWPKKLSWSPQGDFIVILNGTIQTFGIDPAGVVSNSISSQSVEYSIAVAWAPQNNFIAVLSSENDAIPAKIRTFGVDGSGNLTAAIWTQSLSLNLPTTFCWSPNGNFIAVLDENSVHIFGVDVTGHISSEISSLVVTTESELESDILKWSPSGNFIAVMDDNNIITLGVDGTGHFTSAISTQNIEGGVRSLAWSPNSDLIVVTAINNNTIQLFGVNNVGNISSKISSQATGDVPYLATWSPSGNLVAVNISEGSGFDRIDKTQLFKINADLSISALGYSQAFDRNAYDMAWSPNGDFIAVAKGDWNYFYILGGNFNSQYQFSVNSDGILLNDNTTISGMLDISGTTTLGDQRVFGQKTISSIGTSATDAILLKFANLAGSTAP